MSSSFPSRKDASRNLVAFAASGGCLFALVLAALTWWLIDSERRAKEMTRYGEGLAEDVAFLAAEPLRRDDRIGLGLVVGRLVERSEVRGIAVHTEQGQPFVAVGNIASLQEPTYRKRVAAQGTTVGNVYVALNPANFRPAAASYLIVGAVGVAAVLFAFGVGSAVSAYLNRAPRHRVDLTTTAQPTAETDSPESSRYGVVANLFHRASMADDDRHAALQYANEAAARAANLYGGEATELPQVGAMMTFDGFGPERGLDAVCAALLLREVLSSAWPATRIPFRYGVDALSTEQDQHNLVLLSSLAPNGALAIGEGAYSALAPADALQVAPLDNPAVRALASTPPEGIVLDINDSAQAATLAHQAAEIASALQTPDAHRTV